jgi:hypothetical protein
MAELFGRSIRRGDLERHIGRMDQVAGARAFVFDDGPARGMRGIDLWTGSGLELTVLPDRGLDIGPAQFAGRSLAWDSATGQVRPERFEPAGFGWLKTFQGGLLTTCGLRHFGAPDSDEGGESWGLHGRASSLAAEDVAVERGWEGGDYRIRVRGRIVEAEVFRPTLVLERTIETSLGSRTISVRDRVTNAGYATSTAMLLYHCNLGWPLLSEKSRLLVNAESVAPVTDHAAATAERCFQMEPPAEGYKETVYQIVPAAGPDGLCRAALVNPDLDGGMGLLIEWPKATMGWMAEWKMMGEGVYVLGVEPCNCPFPPRAKLRDRHLMPVLKAGESFESGVTFRVLLGTDELAELQEQVGTARPRRSRAGKRSR